MLKITDEDDFILTDKELAEAKNLALSLPVVGKLIKCYELSHENELEELYDNCVNRLKRLNGILKGSQKLSGDKEDITIIKDLLIDLPKMMIGLSDIKNRITGNMSATSGKPETELEKQKRLFKT